MKKLQFKQFQSHRNGVCGSPFYCAVAYDEEVGSDMLITYFPDIKGECCCAVYQLSLLPDITFGVNSWRGDMYADEMRAAVKKYHDDYLKGIK